VNRLSRLSILCAVLGSAGCFWPWSDRAVVDAYMPAAEARQTLVHAQQSLYGQSRPDTRKAELLADSVIRMSQHPSLVLEAYDVKAQALQLAGSPGRASSTARNGVQQLLTLQQGPLSRSLMTALRRLLVTYVDCASAAQRTRQLADDLDTWHSELWRRFSKNAPIGPPVPGEGPAVVNELFVPLEAMAQQAASSRELETKVQEVLVAYVRAFNRKSRSALLRVLEPDSAPAKQVRKDGPPALTSKPVESIDLSSSVRIETAEKSESSVEAATATCNLLAVSPQGWAREVKNVTFSLAQQPDGSWRIRDIRNHP
jgi:hypothetical protein